MFRFLGILIVFSGVTLLVTHPVATHFQTHIPRGTEPADTVPLFNTWTLWWNLDRAEAGLADYWHAPIFHPARGTFAYSEPQPILMILFPLRSWLNLAGLYNSYLWLTLLLNGLVGYALFRAWNFSSLAACCGGVLIETLPFIHWQLGVLQLVPLWGALWVILSLVKLKDSASYGWSVSLGVALAMTYWCCNYYGVFLVVLLSPAGLILVSGRLREGRFWKQVAQAALWFTLLAGPLVGGQLEYLNQSGFERKSARVAQLSAVPEDYTRLPFESPLDPFQYERTEEEAQRWALSPGLFSYLLAAAGLLAYLLSGRHRTWGLFSLVFCVLAYLLSLGPALDELGLPLYRTLTTLVPGYSKIRSLYRFGVFVQLGCVFLGVLFLQIAVECLPEFRSKWLRSVTIAACAVLFGLSLAEHWPPSLQLAEVPWVEREPEWCRYLREETPAGSALACFPFPTDKQAIDYEQQTHWMLAAAWHERPIVNGYSGFLPATYSRIKAAAIEGPDEACLELLRNNGVRYCVLRKSWMADSPEMRERFQNNSNLRLRFADEEHQVEIFEIIE